MKKIKITLEIESKHKNERHVSKLEKLVGTVIRFWKITLASDLRPNAKIRLLCLIVISITLPSSIYLLFRILTLILNHP
jgi:hypothetical protein